MKVLIISHGHPSTSKGGAEIIAYNLFKQLTEHKKIECHFVAVHPFHNLPISGPDTSTDAFNEHQIKSSSHAFDCTNTDQNNFRNQFKHLLQKIQPDIIHLHHCLHLGIDSIALIRNLAPSAKVCITLHDYRMLCLNDGLMITSKQSLPCSSSSPDNCKTCFPAYRTTAIQKRHEDYQKAVASCDAIISPSQFLIHQLKNNRFCRKNIQKINNGTTHQPVRSKHSFTSNQFGFFGTVSEAKGLLTLLQAMLKLQKKTTKPFHLKIFGGGLEGQSAAFQHRVAYICQHLDADVVQWRGPYNPEDLPRLMQTIDWIVVPSIWWENAPLVIQEAFSFSVPVIGSDHGGIAEQIKGKGGLMFRPNDAEHLAQRMAEAIDNRSLHSQLQALIQQPTCIKTSAKQHLKLYEKLLATNARE